MYPYLMDSDHISLIDRAGPEGARIIVRIAALPPDSVAVSLISYEEQMRGWMAEISRVHSVDRQLVAYSRLDRMQSYYCVTPVLPFDEKALAQSQSLWLRRLRVGTMDLKINATTLANKATLITRNTSDFSKVPGSLWRIGAASRQHLSCVIRSVWARLPYEILDRISNWGVNEVPGTTIEWE
jgi:tRNA(fMet)-specific endonuclease VapC